MCKECKLCVTSTVNAMLSMYHPSLLTFTLDCIKFRSLNAIFVVVFFDDIIVSVPIFSLFSLLGQKLKMSFYGISILNIFQ